MAKYTKPLCRLCRREGVHLGLKGTRCQSGKCPLKKGPPGVGPQKRMFRLSDYGRELREKQKLKRMFGLTEKQFFNIFVRSEKEEGITGTNLIINLESRLDTLLIRSHFASSRYQSRQLINHGHILVNGKSVNLPGCQLKIGDVFEAREKSKNLALIRENFKCFAKKTVPDWLQLDENKVKCQMIAQPKREDVRLPVNEQLVVEHYSK